MDGSTCSTHFLHAVNCTDEVGKIDCLNTTNTDEKVLIEVGHTHYFMWYHLSNRHHQSTIGLFLHVVMALFPNKLVQLGWPSLVHLPVRGLLHLSHGTYIRRYTGDSQLIETEHTISAGACPIVATSCLQS